MKSRLLIAAASAALMAVPSLASAHDDKGWYLRGNAGYGIHTDVDITGDIDSAAHGDGLQSEGNVAGSLGLGYDFGNNWRLELDGASLWTDLGSISQIPSTSAKLRTTTGMLNALYDFDEFGSWEPYVGAGVGLVQAQANFVAQDFLSPAAVANPACIGARAAFGNAFETQACSIDDNDTSLGWQLLAGLGYDISEKLKWDTHYRYLDAGSFDFDGDRTNQITGATNAINAAVSGVGAHSLMTGFRYLFGHEHSAPAPIPAPAPVADYKCWDGAMVFNAGQCAAQPAPAPAPQPTVSCWDGSVVFDAGQCPAQPQTYTCWDGSLVYDQAQCPAQISQRGNDVAALCSEQNRQEIIYYEFDKGQSAETRNTINRILDIGQYCNVDNIRVIGHTDTSGSAAYNLALSKRRAKDARDELVRQGIVGERITSEGKGETQPFVPTGDGVKEQLNRRTEVLISLGSVGVIN